MSKGRKGMKRRGSKSPTDILENEVLPNLVSKKSAADGGDPNNDPQTILNSLNHPSKNLVDILNEENIIQEVDDDQFTT